MDQVLGCVGALAGLGAVALAAVAAHVVLPAAELAMLRDAVQMQGWHALALLFTAELARGGGRLAMFAGYAFIFGLWMLWARRLAVVQTAGTTLPPVSPAAHA